MKNCTGIYLQGDDKYYDCVEDSEGGESSVGGANTSDNSVHLLINNTKTLDRMTEYNIVFTITHELWHLYDFSKGDGANWLSDFDFSNLYNANPNSITEYGATTVKRIFCGSGLYVYKQSRRIGAKNIDVYNYFELLPKE